MMNDFRVINKLVFDKENTINILEWDLKTNAPEYAKEDIIKLITSYEDELFLLKTSESYGTSLKELIDSKDYSIEEERILNRLYKDYERFLKVPKDFYKEYVELIHRNTVVWEEAKKGNNYDLFKPYLEKIIKYKIKYLNMFSDNNKLYDVALDDFESGLTGDLLDSLFDRLKSELIPIIKKLKKRDISIKINACDEDVLKCAYYLLDYIGFDTKRGIVANYLHGFTQRVGNNDVRIAFNKNDNAIDFVTTIIHEGGHGILEQNIDPILSSYSCGCASGINALHESQSRFFENILGRNINFWIPIYDDVKKMLGLDVDIYTFVDALNNAYPSLIRTQADELTYVMHIIIRYEIEKELFNGNLRVCDLPRKWNSLMKEYLGVVPSNDRDGLLQDIHWAEGDFGYFPSYLVGSIFDGLFIDIINRDVGDIDELLRNGKIKDITNYLILNVYKTAGAYTGVEVLEKLGVSKLSVEPLIKYFKNKYEEE